MVTNTFYYMTTCAQIGFPEKLKLVGDAANFYKTKHCSTTRKQENTFSGILSKWSD